MNDYIDKRIAELEKELAALRRQKLAALQSQVALLQASLTGAPESAPLKAAPVKASASAAPSGKRKKITQGWAAELTANPLAFADQPRKGRGRPKGKRMSEEDAMALITRLVAAAGKDGTSARKVSKASGLFYPRVLELIDNEKFKKTGEGKWTRYTLKK